MQDAECSKYDTVGEVTRSFEYSPKKEALLVQKLKDVCPESHRHKLLNVCKTHWIQHIDGLEVFLELYEAIVAMLETIKANADRSWNADSTKKAVSNYHAIVNFDFVVTLTVCQVVLAFTKGLTVKMQGTSSDITECFKIFSTLPVTTCKCERNVSALRQLKTYLQTTMSQTRLTGLALLHIHYNMDIDFDEIIRRFARLHPRRMQLANILSD